MAPRSSHGAAKSLNLSAYPCCDKLLQHFKDKGVQQTPLALLQELASRTGQKVVLDVSQDVLFGGCHVSARLEGGRGSGGTALGLGRAANPQLGKQLAAAALLERLLESGAVDAASLQSPPKGSGQHERQQQQQQQQQKGALQGHQQGQQQQQQLGQQQGEEGQEWPELEEYPACQLLMQLFREWGKERSSPLAVVNEYAARLMQEVVFVLRQGKGGLFSAEARLFDRRGREPLEVGRGRASNKQAAKQAAAAALLERLLESGEVDATSMLEPRGGQGAAKKWEPPQRPGLGWRPSPHGSFDSQPWWQAYPAPNFVRAGFLISDGGDFHLCRSLNGLPVAGGDSGWDRATPSPAPDILSRDEFPSLQQQQARAQAQAQLRQPKEQQQQQQQLQRPMERQQHGHPGAREEQRPGLAEPRSAVTSSAAAPGDTAPRQERATQLAEQQPLQTARYVAPQRRQGRMGGGPQPLSLSMQQQHHEEQRQDEEQWQRQQWWQEPGEQRQQQQWWREHEGVAPHGQQLASLHPMPTPAGGRPTRPSHLPASLSHTSPESRGTPTANKDSQRQQGQRGSALAGVEEADRGIPGHEVQLAMGTAMLAQHAKQLWQGSHLAQGHPLAQGHHSVHAPPQGEHPLAQQQQQRRQQRGQAAVQDSGCSATEADGKLQSAFAALRLNRPGPERASSSAAHVGVAATAGALQEDAVGHLHAAAATPQQSLQQQPQPPAGAGTGAGALLGNTKGSPHAATAQLQQQQQQPRQRERQAGRQQQGGQEPAPAVLPGAAPLRQERGRAEAGGRHVRPPAASQHAQRPPSPQRAPQQEAGAKRGGDGVVRKTKQQQEPPQRRGASGEESRGAPSDRELALSPSAQHQQPTQQLQPQLPRQARRGSGEAVKGAEREGAQQQQQQPQQNGAQNGMQSHSHPAHQLHHHGNRSHNATFMQAGGTSALAQGTLGTALQGGGSEGAKPPRGAGRGSAGAIFRRAIQGLGYPSRSAFVSSGSHGEGTSS